MPLWWSSNLPTTFQNAPSNTECYNNILNNLNFKTPWALPIFIIYRHGYQHSTWVSSCNEHHYKTTIHPTIHIPTKITPPHTFTSTSRRRFDSFSFLVSHIVHSIIKWRRLIWSRVLCKFFAYPLWKINVYPN